MSLARSRNGGSSMGKTFSRKKRSARKLAVVHHRREVAVGGRDQPDVGAQGPAAAHALEGPLLEHPQHLALHAERQLADLVEEQRAALGLLEAPRLAAVGAGEGPLLVAEELVLDQRLRDRGAVQGDEGPGLPRRERRGSRGRRAPCRCRSRR